VTCLACDFGGTRIKAGLVADGRLKSSAILPTLAEEPMRSTMDRVADRIESLCHESRVDPRSCTGLATGFPALVDSKRNRVLDHYGKFMDAPAFDFDSWSDDRWGIPIALENDARLALIGEWQHGAGRHCDQLAMVTLGTGIGTAVLLDGQLLRGPNYRAGNLCGHLIVKAGGHHCTCGNQGCVEAETGGGTLAARTIEKLHGLGRKNEIPSVMNYQTLFELAESGVDWAIEMRDSAAQFWAILCANLINTFDLDRVVIGGGVMHASEFLLPVLADQVRQLLIGGREAFELRAAEHPDTMALLGGEWLIQEKKCS